MSKIIGIDLGTTNSCVAVVEGGSIEIIPNSVGGRTTPSIVGFTEKGDRLIGQIAKRQAITNARHTVFAVKRLMGRKYKNEAIQRIKSILPFTVAASDRGDVCIQIKEKAFSPPELSAILLQNLKMSAEEFLGEPLTDAVITVPAYFDDSQRQATKDAGRIAGLEVKRILNEPTAAALAYGHGEDKQETIAIYDLGGGTFDISVLELNHGVYEVLATCGDTLLGGEDFDQKIIEWMSEEFLVDTGIDLRDDILAMQRLKEAAEKAKCELSTVMETHINLPFISADDKGPKHFDRILTRTKFEQLVSDLIERTVDPCMNALNDARIGISNIDKIILVGGQTRTPAVQERVKEIFKREPISDVNPDEVVAVGAAIQGGVLKGEVKDIVLLDVIPLSLGVETHGGLFTKLIPRNSTIPLKKTTIFTTVADNQSTVEVHVLQGEREIAKHNRSLARFELVGIAPAARAVPQIEVTFDIDVNGIVGVSALDQKSLKEQAMKITPSSGLSKEEIDSMVRDAQLYFESDKNEKELTQMKNRIDDLASSVRKSYNEFGWMLDNANQEMVKEAILSSSRVDTEDIADAERSDLTNTLKLMEKAAELLRKVIFSMPDDSQTDTGHDVGGEKKDSAKGSFESDDSNEIGKLPAG